MSLFFPQYSKVGVAFSLLISMAMMTACQKNVPSETAVTSSNSSLSSTTKTTKSATLSNSVSSNGRTIVTQSLSATDTTMPQLANIMTIYTTFDKATLAPLLRVFTEKTDIEVQVVTDTSANLLERLKNEADNTPADLLLIQDVGIFWQAKEMALIQPFNSDKVYANIPVRMRDDNGEWVGVSYYARTAVYDSRAMTANDISSYAKLSKPEWLGKLCLSDGQQVANQSLVINILNNLGESRTVDIVKGWLANLGTPLLGSDEAVLQAIEAGKCQIGLVNSDAYGRFVEKNANTSVKLAWANKGYGGTSINVNGIAITKHAQHPEYALSFLEWLSQKDSQGLFASLTNSYPISYPSPKSAEASVLLKSWGDFEPGPMPLVKYGEMRKSVLELMQTANYQ